mmetsp:Transcript_29459/g.57421  ORF Transcript_29459/g.57421 Transcript_29459/m.57421 type:complete len:217 (+) Transcript_29459:93-743(+)
MCAAANGNVDVAKLLLEAGCDIKVQSRFGSTALSKAAIAGDNRMVELLIEHGAAVNVMTVTGKSLADLALEGGHQMTHDLLVAAQNASEIDHGKDDTAQEAAEDQKSGGEKRERATVRMMRPGGAIVEIETTGEEVFVEGASMFINDAVSIVLVGSQWRLVDLDDSSTKPVNGHGARKMAAKIECIHPNRPLGRQCHDCPRRDSAEYRAYMRKRKR